MVRGVLEGTLITTDKSCYGKAIFVSPVPRFCVGNDHVLFGEEFGSLTKFKDIKIYLNDYKFVTKKLFWLFLSRFIFLYLSHGICCKRKVNKGNSLNI